MLPEIHYDARNDGGDTATNTPVAGFCTRIGDTVVMRGDVTGASLLHVYCAGGHLLADADPARLYDYVRAEGLPLTVCPVAVVQFLTLGLVPLPSSIFNEVRTLGIGDQITFVRAGAGWTETQSVEFPYFAAQSRQDEQPDPERLRTLLTESVGRTLTGAREAALMLSSGKDSTAIAAALARLGRRDVRCLTFVADTDQDEDGYASGLCRKLGLPHERIRITAARPEDGTLLSAFFRNAPLPCADDCQLPYVTAVARAGAADTVLDGSGNDVYMGHVPSRNDRRRAWLRIRGRRLTGVLETIVPFGTKADQLLRDPVDHCFLQGLLRMREVARFYPQAISEGTFRAPLLAAWMRQDVFDFRACVRGRHYDQGSCALKAMVACQAAGKQCLLPWCDADVINYYFNLPRAARFNADMFSNKVLLREMLHREIDYPDHEKGKRYFQFDRIGFFMNNKARVGDEILGCRHWERTASERLLGEIYRRLPRNPRVGVALNAWFLLSGWLNHNRWLNDAACRGGGGA